MSVVTMDTPGLLEHIEAKLEAPRPDCLLWPNAVDRGYGRIYVDGTAKRVHRVVWELKHGPIPEGLTIDHLCRIRSCANTEHMELVTQAENTQRAVRARRVRRPERRPKAEKKTLRIPGVQCDNGHPYTAENTRIQASGKRKCRTCARASKAREVAKRRADRAAERAAA